MSLGVVRRLTILTFEMINFQVDKDAIATLITKFEFAAAGFDFTHQGFRVKK